MKKSSLKKYAELIAQKGVCVQKGQEVIIRAELDQPDFVMLVTEELYKAGAKKVMVEWSFQPMAHLTYKYRDMDTLSKIENWEIEKLKWRCQENPAMLYLISEDPDGLNGIDQTKISKSSQNRYPILKPFIDEMDNKYQWCIAAVPGVDWAKKIFPELSKKQAVEKLWEKILMCSRADENPIKAWENHINDLHKKSDYLNSLGIETLEYKSKNGTNLKVGLIEDAQFLSVGEYTVSNHFFIANIPSEEIFISPMRGKAEGIVYSTKPLSFRGELIENFSIEFENGKVKAVHALKNEELLKEMVSQDEGASYLGECALVPYNSPINNSGILFYNTLFDENACCHLALGRGFTNCLIDFGKYTSTECEKKGINTSMIHEDFMIGTDDLDIVGITRDGKRVQIFQNGNWAF